MTSIFSFRSFRSFFGMVVLIPSAALAAAPVNIISIVTDDQAQWSVGAYGNTECKTPNMDRLAREGALFENAFVSTPVCSPSRAAFLTGRYGVELGITDWIGAHQNARGVGLTSSTVTWPRLLQDAGYRTSLFGKWHLGIGGESHPLRQGFGHFFGFLGGGNSPMDPRLQLNEEAPKQLSGSLPDILTDRAIDWIDDSASSAPFAMLLHFRAPHSPYAPVPEVDSDPYQGLTPTIPNDRGLDEDKVRRQTREYYGSIHSVDRNIGRLLAFLDDRGLTSNTVVLFSSDHGYNIGRHMIHSKGNGNWIAGGIHGPKRPNMWDTSIKVPFLVRWPGVITPGTRVSESVSNVDVFPTIAEIAKVTPPTDWPLRGRSIMTLFKKGSDNWDNTIYGDYDLHNGGLAYMRMIRTPKYKLVRHYRAYQLDELYDLQADPEENNNLFRRKNYAQTVRDLQTSLTAWQRSINDPLLPEIEKLGQLEIVEEVRQPSAPQTD